MHCVHHRDFLPLDTVVSAKRQQNISVSLVIPALNEEETIGPIVKAARTQLLEKTGVIDEIVVMDGSSGDGTHARATDEGAKVYRTSDVFPSISAVSGKGSSLWKSLMVTGGDIIIFIDADIRNFDTRFIYGLAAPLILDQQVQCSKAFYRRPFGVSTAMLEGYGGRVTEILVRPLFCAWYPELAHIRQPLAGEYAFRRSVAEDLSFSSGYSVELLLMMGLYRQYGLAGLVQVDMEERVHRNRPVDQLGLMAFSILRTFFNFLRDDGRMTQAEMPKNDYIGFISGAADTIEYNEEILPPIRQLRESGKLPRLF